MANLFSEVGSQLVEKAFSGILIFGIIFIVIGVLGFTGYYFFVYKRKFDIKLKIISQRSQDKDGVLFDMAAILIDRKTKSKYLKFWNLKIELPIPTFNVIQRSNRGDYIELLRTGEDMFYYLLPPKIKESFVLREGTKIYPIAHQKLNLIDPDMAFWAVKRKSMNRGMFDPENLFMKILPYLPLILGGAFMVFILYILMSYLPDVLRQLKELVSALASAKNAEIIVSNLWQPLL